MLPFFLPWSARTAGNVLTVARFSANLALLPPWSARTGGNVLTVAVLRKIADADNDGFVRYDGSGVILTRRNEPPAELAASWEIPRPESFLSEHHNAPSGPSSGPEGAL